MDTADCTKHGLRGLVYEILFDSIANIRRFACKRTEFFARFINTVKGL